MVLTPESRCGSIIDMYDTDDIPTYTHDSFGRFDFDSALDDFDRDFGGIFDDPEDDEPLD